MSKVSRARWTAYMRAARTEAENRRVARLQLHQRLCETGRRLGEFEKPDWPSIVALSDADAQLLSAKLDQLDKDNNARRT